MSSTEKSTSVSCSIPNILIFECPSIYISGIGIHGMLRFYRQKIEFIPATSLTDRFFNIQYSDISDVSSNVGLCGAIQKLIITTKSSIQYQFTGLKDSDRLESFIKLNIEQLSHPSNIYGFIEDENKKITWKDLAHPTNLVHASIPGPMNKVLPLIQGKDILQENYLANGSEDIVFGEWIKCDGYTERRIDYMKCVIAPVIGKTLIKVAEFQRLFQIDDKRYGMNIESDLGKTPYADCFAPIVQVIYTDKGNSVDIDAKLEIIWSSEPFVKGIILNKTTEEVQSTYQSLTKLYQKAFGSNVDENQESQTSNQNNSNIENFRKISIVYKIIIWLLLVTLTIIVLSKFKIVHKTNYPIGSLLSLSFFVFLCLFF